MRRIIPAIFILLFLILSAQQSMAVLLDFENLPDQVSVGDFYAVDGVHFLNAISLTAGFSLNEFDYPPSSGLIAIGDDYAPITISFDNPVDTLFAHFTYGSQLTFTAFDPFGSLLGSYTTPAFSNLGNSELITLGFSGVGYLVVAGQSVNSFIMDDFNFNPTAPVPEPSTLFLFGSGALVFFSYRLRICFSS